MRINTKIERVNVEIDGKTYELAEKTVSIAEKLRDAAMNCYGLPEYRLWLKELEIPVLAVFTKADKIARAKRKALIMQYVRQGIYSWTLPLAVSVEEPGTIDAFKAQLDQYLEQLLSQE